MDHAAKAATCTEPGWAAYQTCSRCDYSSYVEIPALDHDYGEPIYEWSADLKQATAKVVCANDPAHVISETVDTVYTVTVKPTCTEPGKAVYAAGFNNKRFYGQTKEVDLAALGHDYVEHEAKAATCTEPGWAAYQTCSRCDDTTYKEIPAAGHAPAEAVKENETNASYDLVVYCGLCGIELSRETVETGSVFLPGDPDCDGEVTAADARLALRRAVDLETYAPGSPEFLACDADGDGEITAADARLILRCAVDLTSRESFIH